jgi:hypothetical protein
MRPTAPRPRPILAISRRVKAVIEEILPFLVAPA